MENITLKQGDCLELMKDIPDKSIDMILCDLPYGTTTCKWDEIIPFEALWEAYERIIKDNGAIILFSSQPFTSKLIMSNLKMFKEEIIWNKVSISSGILAKKRHLKNHENIIIFYKKQPAYNPQMYTGEQWSRGGVKKKPRYLNKGELIETEEKNKGDLSNLKYPKSIITFSNANKNDVIHPTQKPVALLEYLIKTYTNEGETVLDNTMGSGSTGVACVNTNRKFIGIELDENYFNIAKERIQNTQQKGEKL